jgi:hypothetical protein
MDPAVWGPTCWKLMFAACFRLPTARTIALLEALRHLLPCIHCRRSYCMYLDAAPPHVAIREQDGIDGVAKFCWSIKDRVNLKVGMRPMAYSTIRAKFTSFGQPFSRMDVVDFLCCTAVHIESMAQVRAYADLAAVMQELCKVCGEPIELRLPMASSYESPPTAWLHALACKNDLCASLAQPQLSRDAALAIYRGAPKTTTTTTTTSAAHAAAAAATRTAQRPRVTIRRPASASARIAQRRHRV